MPAPKVRQFAGDFRLWEKSAGGVLSAVIASALDPEGNQPIETNAMSFAYTAGDETKILSKRRGNLYQQPVFTDTLPGTTEVTIGLLEVPPAIMARILFGELAEASISTGSITDGARTVERLDAPMQLAHRYIKASPAPTVETAADVALVLDEDYKIDLRKGTIVILSAGTVGATIAVGDALKVNYSYESVDGTTILGGAVPAKSFFITGDMQDRVSGEDGYLQVYEVPLSVDGDIDWLSTEPMSPTLKGTALVPNGAPAPYKFDTYKLA